ncbi:MAG: two-component regulator propeller domain-containing protein [Bacteroidota bacterium]
MTMRGWYCCAVLLLVPGVVLAGTGTWKNYTSMKDVKGLARSGSVFWAATSGGFFRWEEGTTNYLAFTNAEGLKSIDLTAIATDRSGDVWTGTSGGLIQVYTPATGSLRMVPDIAEFPGQSNKSIRSFTTAGDSLLVATDFGLSIYRLSRNEFGDTFTRFGSYPPNVRVTVFSGAINGGRIWASVSDGLSTHRIASASLSSPNLLEPQSWTLDPIGSAGTVPGPLAVMNGRLYAGTSTGLYYYDGNTWAQVTALAGKSVVAMGSSPLSLAVCTTAGEVFVVDTAASAQSFGTTLSIPAAAVAMGSNGSPVVGSMGGGILTFASAWTTHFPNGPNSNQFINVVVGPDGTVWGASGESSGKGVYRFDGKGWISFTMQNSSLPADEVYRVSMGCNGSLWASTYGRGIAEIPAGAAIIDSSHVFGRNVGMMGLVGDPSYVVTSSVVCDGAGNTWTSIVLPADRNVIAVRRANGTWRTLPVIVGGARVGTLMDRPVDRLLAVDASDNLWTVVRDPGFKGVVSLGNRGSIDSVAAFHVTTAHGLPSDDVKTIVVDKENDIWVGTDRGIAIILDPSNPTRTGAIAAYKPLLGVVINSIAVDPLNQKWVGTTEGAVLLSPDGTQQLATYTVENTGGRLIDNDVKSVAIDRATGTIYFGTAYGLASLTTAAAAPKEEFDKLLAYPNPYRVPSTVPVTIDGLVANSLIKILTLDGALVREIKTPGGRIGFWDGRDDRGSVVASGIYLVVGYSEDGSQTGAGKLAVIRQ